MKEFIAKEEEEKKGFDCMVCKSKSLNAIGKKKLNSWENLIF
jgi:hypothetical protein